MTASTPAVSSSFVVRAAAPSKLVFVQQPVNAVAGSTLNPVVVDVEDKYGNVVTGDHSNLTLSFAHGPSGCRFNGVATIRAVNGVATFSNLSLTTAGTYQLRASDGSLDGATSNSFTISAGQATQMSFQTRPSNCRHGKSSVAEVVLLDKYGNVAVSNNSSVTLKLGTHPKNAVLSGTTTVAVINGIATFNNLLFSVAGQYSLVATDSKGIPSVTSTLFSVA